MCIKIIIVSLIVIFPSLSFSQSTGQMSDYVIESQSGVINAYSRSGLLKYTGTDAYTVIQSAINAVSTGNGGSIAVASGIYYLSNELTINGWDSNTPPTKQITLTGNGYATQLVQTTKGKNAIVVKNKASVVITGFYIYTGSVAKSGILLDDSGTNSNISVWGATIDNIFIQSNSTASPAFYAINFFSLNIPRLTAINSSNHGIILENTSTTTNYGNSSFGLIIAGASSAPPYAGLYLKSSNSNGRHYLNLITFQNYQCGFGYRGIYSTCSNFNTFNFVDIEGMPEPIVFDGNGKGGESRNNKVLSGYLLPSTGGTAITNTLYTGGNDFNVFIEGDAKSKPILDQQQYRPPNSYNVIVSNANAAANINIKSKASTPLILRKGDATVTTHMPNIY